MGLKDSLVSMMGDFVQMNKNPDFRSKSDVSASHSPDCSPSSPSATGPKRGQPRRHSLSINVVGKDVGDVRQRTFSITPEMQKHLEKINKRAMKKSATESETASLRPRHRLNGDDEENVEEEEEAARRRFCQRPRRCSEPVNMTLAPIKERRRKNSPSKQKSVENDDDDGGEDSAKHSTRSRHKRGSDARSRSRSRAAANRKHSSNGLSLKIDEEECDADGNCRVVPPQSQTMRRLVALGPAVSDASLRGSSASGPPATPIPEDWEAEQKHGHASHVSCVQLGPLAVELNKIEADNNCERAKDAVKEREEREHKEKEKENHVAEKIERAPSRKLSSSCGVRKSSVGSYPPPTTLLTSVTRF